MLITNLDLTLQLTTSISVYTMELQLTFSPCVAISIRMIRFMIYSNVSESLFTCISYPGYLHPDQWWPWSQPSPGSVPSQYAKSHSSPSPQGTLLTAQQTPEEELWSSLILYTIMSPWTHCSHQRWFQMRCYLSAGLTTKSTHFVLLF